MSDPGPEPDLAFLVTVIILMTLISAFLSSAEVAFASLNKNRLKQLAAEGSRKAELLEDVAEEPNKYLSIIQILIMFVGFLASAYTSVCLSGTLALWLTQKGIPYGMEIAVALITIALSYIVVVLGIMLPKRIAYRNAEKVALHLASPVLLIAKLFSPFLFLLYGTVRLLMRLVGKELTAAEDEYSEDDIKSMLEVGQESGQLNETGREMINSIFEFDDKLAYEIMTPRTDVYSIDINEDLSDYIDELLEERYSRIPVYDKDGDDIIGVLFMKDFFMAARRVGFENVDIKPLLQKPFFVPESKKINDLFTSLQLSKMHIAMLIDEYGGFSGIVTMEDIIEEVMGDIDDEYDDDEPKLEKLDENTFMVDGQYYLDDLSQELNYSFESENHETIGGLIIDLMGEIPDEDEKEDRIVEYDGCVFKVESVKDRRIDKVKIYIPPKADELRDRDENIPISEVTV